MSSRKGSFFNKKLGKSTEELQFEFAENNNIKLQLSDKRLVFHDGKWNLDNSENKDVSTLLKERKDLIEENNFLKLKNEVLLLMLAEMEAKSAEN